MAPAVRAECVSLGFSSASSLVRSTRAGPLSQLGLVSGRAILRRGLGVVLLVALAFIDHSQKESPGLAIFAARVQVAPVHVHGGHTLLVLVLPHTGRYLWFH